MFWKRFSVAVHEAEGGDLESGRSASTSTIELKKTGYVYILSLGSARAGLEMFGNIARTRLMVHTESEKERTTG